MSFNWIVIILSALIPLVVGALWYSPMMFLNAWLAASGLNQEQLKGANMVKIFGLTFLFSLMIALAVNFLVIHQWSIYSILAGDPTMSDPNSETGKFISDFMAKNGQNFRTFKHGVFHGVEFALLLIFPILGINSLFERRPFKYTLIHTGYWMVTIALMGGVICQFM